MSDTPTPMWFDATPGAARQAAVRLLEEAVDAGAAHAEAFVVRTEARRLDHGDPGVRSEVDFRCSLRVWSADGAIGLASTRGPALHADDHQALIAEALASAALVPGSETAPPVRLDIPDRGLDIHDRRYPHIDDEMRREVVRSNVTQAMEVHARVAEVDFRYEELQATRGYASSRRVTVEEHGTRFALIGSAATEAGGERVRGQVVSRNFAEVASRPLGHELGTHLIETLTPADLPGSPTTVVLDQRAVAALLPRLVAAFSAERIAEGGSYLQGRVGSRIASRELHVVDDARRAGGMATRGFDERGVPPVSVNLIKEGRASGLYQGPRSAERTGARPSGHERADGTLWPGNLVVRPGSRSRNMLFPDLGTFVLVTELTDTHGIDPATGEIDVGARVFVADADGIRGCAGVHRLRCTADALLGGVQRVCNDQQRHGIVDTATWLVDGIWFS